METQESIKAIIDQIGRTEDKLIEIFIEVQRQNDHHYLSETAMDLISKELVLPLSKVYGIASFYSMLSTKKRGKYVVQVCNSSPCYLNGGKDMVKTIEDILGTKVGFVTDDGMFSLESTSCIGACDQAPAIRINDQLYGNLNRGKVYKLIDTIRKGATGE